MSLEQKIFSGRSEPLHWSPNSNLIIKAIDSRDVYLRKPNNPKFLFDCMRAFWEAKQGNYIFMPELHLSTSEIREGRKRGDMAIFKPLVNLMELGKMFPQMGDISTYYNTYNERVSNSGWLWVEASIFAPNRNKCRIDMEREFKRRGRQGQSLTTYIIYGQFSKFLTGRYPDERSCCVASSLLGSISDGQLVIARFSPNGYLHISWDLIPGYKFKNIGGRSEKVIQS